MALGGHVDDDVIAVGKLMQITDILPLVFCSSIKARRDRGESDMKTLSTACLLLACCLGTEASAFGRIRPVLGESRIANGGPAARGQFPHMAALFVEGRFSCGGALVDSRHVLTAGRCVFGTSEVDVYLGAQDLSASEEGRVTQTSQTTLVHPGYRPFPYHDDIAVVQLPEAVVFNDFVQPIALPSSSDDSFEGSPAIISGWGKTSMDSTTYSSTLNFVTLTVISNEECSQVYTEIVPSLLCASTPGKGICYGDVGGPLAVQATLVGISSFVNSFGCDSGAPSGYTRITSYLSWITDNVGSGKGGMEVQK